MTPRYKVTVSDIAFSPLNHCDTAAEEDTEWNVSRGPGSLYDSSIVPDREWTFDRRTNPRVVVGDWALPQFEAFPDSGFSLELKASDHPRLGLSITELDPLFDDSLFGTGADLNPLDGSRSVELQTHQIDVNPLDGDESECRAESRFAVDVRPLEPGLDGGPVLSQ